MSNWFEWNKEGLSELGINDHEFFDYLKAGLCPHEKYTKKPAPCPNKHHAYNELFEQHGRLTKKLQEFETFKGQKPQVPKEEHGKDLNLFASDLIIDCLATHHITVNKLKTEIKDLEENMEAIVEDDPDFLKWKYFVVPKTYQECGELKSKLTKENVFRKDVALKIHKKSMRESTNKRATGKKLRPNQKAKIECRRVAEGLWKEDRSMTIVDVEYQLAIQGASRKPNGELYSKKTVRDWIKDLCPDRSPGRRPKMS